MEQNEELREKLEQLRETVTEILNSGEIGCSDVVYRYLMAAEESLNFAVQRYGGGGDTRLDIDNKLYRAKVYVLDVMTLDRFRACDAFYAYLVVANDALTNARNYMHQAI